MNNNLLIDFNKLKVGQKLWHVVHGELMINNLNNNSIHYPLTCDQLSFSKNGKSHIDHKYPSLYLSNPFEQINEFPKLMEVSNNREYWSKEKVIYKTASHYIAVNDKSGHIIKYEYAREIQEPVIIEYTLEEIADKFGVDVNTIRIKK